MDNYKIKITEKLQRIVEVKANDQTEALEEVIKMYRDEKIVLNADDFKNVTFKNI